MQVMRRSCLGVPVGSLGDNPCHWSRTKKQTCFSDHTTSARPAPIVTRATENGAGTFSGEQVEHMD